MHLTFIYVPYQPISSFILDTKLVFGQQVKIKFKMKAITLKSIFYSNIRYYNISGESFPSSDNNTRPTGLMLTCYTL